MISFRRGKPNYVGTHTLSLAIDCSAAVRCVSKPLATRLRTFVDREDKIFCSWKHDVAESGGFLIEADRKTGEPSVKRSPLWDAHYGGSTTAMTGMMCVSRYENSGKIGYRELITAAADAYLDANHAEGADAWPMTFGHVISLELAAWRSTANRKYLDRARALGLTAVKLFFQDKALPRASLKTGHYAPAGP